MRTNQQIIGQRFSITTALVFIAGMLIGWESAYLAAVFVTILLEKGMRIPIRNGIVLLLTTFAIYFTVFILFTLLLQYPVLFFIALIGALACVFALSVAGKSSLLVTMSLFAVLIIPYVTASSTNAAWTQAVWMPMNLGIALVATWIAFLVIPPTEREPHSNNEVSSTQFNTKIRFMRMMLSTAPFVLFFLLIEGDHLLTLLYFGLFANQLASTNDNATVTPFEKLQANLVAVLASLVAYELIVMVPNVVMMGLVSLLLCLCYGSWLSSGHEKANLARSALTGAIILLGSAMVPLADTVEISSIERIFEISAAVLLVTLMFIAINHVLPDQKSVPAKVSDVSC